MLTIALCVALLAPAYCLYLIRRLRSDIAIAVGTTTIFLDYITEQRGPLLYLVIDSLKSGSGPPPRASTLEVKVARLMMSFPTSREEFDSIWNWQPQEDRATTGNQA